MEYNIMCSPTTSMVDAGVPGVAYGWLVKPIAYDDGVPTMVAIVESFDVIVCGVPMCSDNTELPVKLFLRRLVPNTEVEVSYEDAPPFKKKHKKG